MATAILVQELIPNHNPIYFITRTISPTMMELQTEMTPCKFHLTI